MYIINFTFCLIIFFSIMTGIFTLINKIDCRNEALTHLFKHSLTKTLDKQLSFKRINYSLHCAFGSYESNQKFHAQGLNFKQTLNINFKGKASNGN